MKGPNTGAGSPEHCAVPTTLGDIQKKHGHDMKQPDMDNYKGVLSNYPCGEKGQAKRLPDVPSKLTYCSSL